ncbi:P-loop NTPase [Synechococcus sp. BIOS-E4-1]|uniref:P-loop NTPase n=1 Tax=Synechococcus sp. BIOS-E4-1 TaxID=1400864 RepID=UPI0016448FD2|nr:P-loop NTPase [Synechococcus sp. BIOS-E4-1]
MTQEEFRLKEVRDCLDCVKLPGSQLSIIKAALARNIRVIQDDIYVRLFHGSDQIELVLNTQNALSALAWSNRIIVDPRSIPGVKRTIAIGSGKGGVGKTTVTVGLANSLSKSGYNVGILDADIYGPNVSTLLGVDSIEVDTFVSNNRTRFIPATIRDLKVMSVGMLADASQSLAWRGPILTKLLKQFLFDVEWGELDFLLIDLPPGTGDAQITILQECPLAGVLLVGVPGTSSQADLVRTIAMYKQFDLTILGYVENFSSIECPNCGNVFPFLLDYLPEDQAMADIKDLEVLVHLPVQPDVLTKSCQNVEHTLGNIYPESFLKVANKCKELLV